MMMSDLPQDLLEEILSRVYATTLSRLRSTCKRWNALVKDKRFTEKHFRKAPKQYQGLMLKEYKVFPMSVNLNINVAPPSIEFKGALGLKKSHSKLEEVDIADVLHCDGLLLCTTKNNRLVVWNPCLGETRWIQPKTGRYSRFVLGYENNKSCHRYKILWCLDIKKPNHMCEIYEFSTDSWRVLDDISLNFVIPPNHVSLKGNSFWLAWDSNSQNSFVLSFDFTTERVKRFCLPQIQNPGSIIKVLSIVREEQLSVLDLVSLFPRKMDVWVTNEIDTDAALSWTKSFTVDFQSIRSKYIPNFVSFLIDEEKKVVLCCDFNYGLRMDMVYTFGEDGEYYTEIPNVKYTIKSPLDYPTHWPFIFSYVPSLVDIQQDRHKRQES